MPNTPAQVEEAWLLISAWRVLPRSIDTSPAVVRGGQGGDRPEVSDAVTAISGSGPAVLVVEAMIDAGVLGLPRDIATTLVVQTINGLAKLLSDSGLHPTVLQNASPPGGTTAAWWAGQYRVKAAFITATRLRDTLASS